MGDQDQSGEESRCSRDFLTSEKGGKERCHQSASKKRRWDEESKSSTTHSSSTTTPVTAKKSATIALELKADSKDEKVVQEKKSKVASIFNNDSDSEEEEMPLECRMKMRNIGRNTITSAGPKSFNKGKHGFINNSFKAFEMSMKPRNNLEKKTSFHGIDHDQ